LNPRPSGYEFAHRVARSSAEGALVLLRCHIGFARGCDLDLSCAAFFRGALTFR